MAFLRKVINHAIGAGLITALSSASGAAWAANAIEPLLTGGLNVFIDDSAETLEDRDGDGFLGVGDSLYGMFLITRISNSGGNTLIGNGTLNNEFTGVFANRVQSFTLAGVPGNDADGSCTNATCTGVGDELTGDEILSYVFEPDPAFEALVGLPANTFQDDTMLAFFEDAGQNYNQLLQANIGTATDGTLRIEAGLPGTDPDEQWIATGSSDPLAGDTFSTSTVLATFNVNLSIIADNFGGDFLTDVPIAGSGTGAVGADGLIDLSFSGNVSGTGVNCDVNGENCTSTEFGTDWPLNNATSIRVSYIPEPGTLGMLSIGLLALGGGMAVRRRRAA